MIKYFQLQGYHLLQQRWRTPFAEIDLLFSSPLLKRSLLMIEVKKRNSGEFRNMALSRRQKQRLARVIAWLSESGYLVECQLVFVGANQEIEIQTEVFG